MGGGKRVVVAGATGYLGRYVVRELHERGYRVRALVRSEERLGFARSFADEVFVGQATRPETLDGLCKGAQVVFSSLGIRAVRGRVTFWDVDRDANLHLLRLAADAGVKRFVFVSVVHGEQMPRLVPQIEAREQVVDALFRSGLAATIIRPTGFFNDMAEFFRMAQAGRVWLVGDGRTQLNPVHGADLATFVTDRIEEEATGAFDVGGPETFSQQRIGELAFETLARPPRFGHVPPGLLKGAAWIVRPFSANLNNILRFGAALGETDVVAPATGDHRLRTFFEDLRDGRPIEEAGNRFDGLIGIR